MKLADSILHVVVAGAPLFFVLVMLFLVFSWIRLLIDAMSGRGM